MMEKEEICSNFQLKVEAAENKLKECEQTVSLTLQRKVKQLEGILKERTGEFELHSGRLQQKVKELENKLKMEGESGGSLLHQQKVNELEQKLRQHQEEPLRQVYSAEKLLGTPIATSTTEAISGMDPPSLRSLNCNSRTRNMGSDLLKGTDSLRELRRKKQVQSKGTENNLLLSSSLLDKKTLSTESNKARQVDTSRALARITRSTKSVNTVGKALSSYKINRDQATGLRESSSKLKMWLR